METERKYLVTEVPKDLDAWPREDVAQGYIALTEDGTEVRVRRMGAKYYETVKTGQRSDARGNRNRAGQRTVRDAVGSDRGKANREDAISNCLSRTRHRVGRLSRPPEGPRDRGN